MQTRSGLYFLGGLAIGALIVALVLTAFRPSPNPSPRSLAPRETVRAGGGAPVRRGTGAAPGAVRVTDEAAAALRQWTEADWEEAQGPRALGAALELYALAGRGSDFAATAARLLDSDAESALRILNALDLLPPEIRAGVLEDLLARSPAILARRAEVASRLAAAGRIDRALALMEAALREGEASPGDFGAVFDAAPERFAAIAMDVARAAGWDAAGWNGLVGRLQENGRDDLALTALRTAIGLGLTNLDTIGIAASLDSAVAEMLALRRVEADPGDVAGWRALAGLRKQRGDMEGAFAAFEKCARLRLDRGVLSALVELDPARALPLVAALTAETNDDESIGALAGNYEQLGRAEDAWEAFYRAHRIDPDDGEWLDALVRLDPQRAVEVFEKRLEEGYGSNQDEFIGHYAEALAALGRTAEAWEQYHAAYRLDTSDSEWMEGMGAINPHRTIALLKQDLERNPGNDGIVSGLIKLLPQVGRQGEVLALVRDRIEAQASPTGWLMALSESMPAEAEQLTRRKLEQRPTDDELWGTLGKILFKQQRNGQALEAFRRANELDPSDSEWHGYFEQLGVPVPRHAGRSSELIEEEILEEPFVEWD